jgi:hypothetical protein
MTYNTFPPTSSFPQWTAKIAKGKDVVGEDMLGLEGAAQGYQQNLIPGIISTTNRARYYSFYAWALHRFIESGSRLMKDFRGPFFRRHEVALILGSYSHHLEGQIQRNLVGAGNNANKVRTWWDENDPISLDVDYFKNKLGGFGQYYYTSMRELEIVLDSEQPKWVYRLSQRFGEALTRAYEKSIAGTRYYKKLTDSGELEFLSHRDALDYGKSGCICGEALSTGHDLPILRDAFFRFDQVGTQNKHASRRRSLGVILDMINASQGKFTGDMIHPTLYLGEFAPKMKYIPSTELTDWHLRWRMVAIRHQYTFALQLLWAAFILRLRDQETGISLEEFLVWARNSIGADIYDLSLGKFLSSACQKVGAGSNWETSHQKFGDACLQSSGQDEFSLYKEAKSNPEDPDLLLDIGINSLAQFYLRFLQNHQNQEAWWSEMAKRERLPINSFYTFVGKCLDENSTIGQWLEQLYLEFILGQHEFIALRKLRVQRYDTFKFYLRDGRFHWPFRRKDHWREPIRLAGNRLQNALSILQDLNLIHENDGGQLSLSKDGKRFLSKTLECIVNGD